MKIGLNSLTFNNDINILKNVKDLIDTYECTKFFYLDHHKELENIDTKCETFSSLIVNNYDLLNKNDRNNFKKELQETCKMANSLGATKLMFGMVRFRKNINEDVLKFFEELYHECKHNDLELMYEAISNKDFDNNWLINHYELIYFSNKLNTKGIHVDFGTLISENEDFDEIVNLYNIINIHYPFGKEININYDISLENYSKNKLTEKEIVHWLEHLNESKRL